MAVAELPAKQESREAGRHPESAAEDRAGAKRTLFRRPGVIVTIAILAIAGILYATSIAFHGFTHESTDDAFIDGHVISIAPKIAARVAKVLVDDNQQVKKGDALIELETADVQATVAQRQAAVTAEQAKARNAQAAAEQADAHLRTLQAFYDSAAATAAAAQADVVKLRGDLQRNQQLITSGAISKQDYEHTAADAAAAEANFASKKKQMDAANAYLDEARKAAEASHLSAEAGKATATETEAALSQANLQASYAKIVAPADGRITNKAVESGDYVQVGQTLCAIVPPEIWITANFKETQLRDMRPGEPAEISVDAYPERALRGHVDSIQAGSGARFSLVPPENATGNYVKVVQRVPVKIVFDEQPDVQRALGPGMSAVPDVKIDSGFGAAVKIGIVAILAILLVLFGTGYWLQKIQTVDG